MLERTWLAFSPLPDCIVVLDVQKTSKAKTMLHVCLHLTKILLNLTQGARTHCSIARSVMCWRSKVLTYLTQEPLHWVCSQKASSWFPQAMVPSWFPQAMSSWVFPEALTTHIPLKQLQEPCGRLHSCSKILTASLWRRTVLSTPLMSGLDLWFVLGH